MGNVQRIAGGRALPMLTVAKPRATRQSGTTMSSMSEIKWFHSMELEPGVHTISKTKTDDLRAREESYFKGVDFTGKTVLDIGAWDGYFSFAAKRRGASRVLATDHFCWSGKGWGSKAGFDFANEKLATNIESLDVDVLDLSPERHGTFDIVLFLGVFYHLRDPLLGLGKAAALAKETIVVETVLDAKWMRRPAMVFYPGRELNNDPTNWWGPNSACVIAMLEDLGFRRIDERRDPIHRGRAHFVARRQG
jgi:tRNA (mo5U34)-methyltransferase